MVGSNSYMTEGNLWANAKSARAFHGAHHRKACADPTSSSSNDEKLPRARG